MAKKDTGNNPPDLQANQPPAATESAEITSEKIISLGHTGGINSVAVSHDDRLLFSASDDQTVRVWEVESGRCLRTLEGHTDFVRSVALSHDDRLALLRCSQQCSSPMVFAESHSRSRAVAR